VVFLSFESVDAAREAARVLEKEAQGIQVIAVCRSADPAVLRETMRVGVREFLCEPFEHHLVRETLEHAMAILARQPVSVEATSQIFAFLPAKAGVGTSTIALNVSAAFAARPSTRTLLCDLDLNSGIVRFMLKLNNGHSVIDAVEHAPHMDEHLWPQLVTSIGALDVLHAGQLNPSLRIEPSNIRNLVDFSRRNYQALCFDLSGNLERYSLELMQEAKRILLVCTPELPALYLAREKIQFLRDLDLYNRVGVLLNRYQKRALVTKEQVEEILGLEVAHLFPNDYQSVSRAISAGSWIDQKSPIGKEFAALAQELLDWRIAGAQDMHRYIEPFTVPTKSLVGI